MPQHAPPEVSSADRLRNVGNGVVLVLRSIAVMAEVGYLRKGFGQRYLGMQAAVAVPVLIVYSMFWAGQDLRPLMGYLLMYLGMCGVARIDMLRRRWRGCIPVHSRYNGFPRLARFCPRMSEVAIKTKAEPALVVALGLLVLTLNPPLGFFLLLTAFALAGTTGMIDAHQRLRALDMHDMVIDQQQVAERFRTLRGQY